MREDFWNIGYPFPGALVYIAAPVAAAFIAWGLWRRARMWRTGAPMPDLGPWARRLRKTLKLVAYDVLAHRRFIHRELYPGLMHAALFWGIAVLAAATVLTAIEHNVAEYLGRQFPTVGWRVQTGFVWDVFGGLVAGVGVGMAAWRRYVTRPARLNTVLDDGVTLALLALVLLTGFLLEGLRIGATELNPVSSLYSPASAHWSPVGYAFARAVSGLGATPGTMEAAHAVVWWAHVGIVTAGTAYVALRFGKLSHLVAAPLNVLFRPDRRCGVLRPMGDFEQLSTFGAKDLPDLPWNQLLAFDACTNCGRCQDQCPAWISGKPLSPRRLVQDMRTYMEERAPRLLAARHGEAPPPPERSMVSDAAGEDELWACTTCAACAKACPVFVEHIDTIIDMRRYLTMEEVRAPAPAQAALQSLEQRGHPWRGTTLSRTDWMAGLDVPTMARRPGAEYLFWVGCTGALVERCVAVTRVV
ncbi:MAG: (Fe-S)-binding protein, partial [Gemmatimonadetes bacterium]|nr:(Fe-S)-binding protein [Gemmatimonadota bacterium]